MPRIELGSQLITVELTASAAISDQEVVYMSGEGQVAPASGSEVQQSFGVADEAASSGDTLQVAVMGKKTVVADGAISPGDPVVPAATAGRAVAEANAPASHTHTMGTHSHNVADHSHTMGTHSHIALSTTGSDASPGAHQPVTDGGGASTTLQAAVDTSGQASDTVSTDAVDPGDTNAGGPGSTDAADPGDTNSADASPDNARTFGIAIGSASAAGENVEVLIGAKSG